MTLCVFSYSKSLPNENKQQSGENVLNMHGIKCTHTNKRILMGYRDLEGVSKEDLKVTIISMNLQFQSSITGWLLRTRSSVTVSRKKWSWTVCTTARCSSSCAASDHKYPASSQVLANLLFIGAI